MFCYYILELLNMYSEKSDASLATTNENSAINFELADIIECRGIHGTDAQSTLYRDFVETMVSGVTSRIQFKQLYLNKEVSDFITTNDEAFALLTIENNWDRWCDMYRRHDMSKFNCQVPSLYTNAGDARNNNKEILLNGKVCVLGSTCKHQGFSQLGLQRFNALCKIIKQERHTKQRRDAEIRWKEDWISQISEGINAHPYNSKAQKKTDNVISIEQELWSDDENIEAQNHIGNNDNLSNSHEQLHDVEDDTNHINVSNNIVNTCHYLHTLTMCLQS